MPQKTNADATKELYLKDTVNALLNILDDFSEEKSNAENNQNALLNILDDYGVEKINMEQTELAVFNILEDYNEEKIKLQDNQKALLNILEDYSSDKASLENTQHAILNILEDYGEEKLNLENTQVAVLNILEDYGEEKNKVENINKNLSFANKELEQFAYVASHDLQEPLRTISNFVGLFEKQYAEKLDEDSKQYLGFILIATSKMQTLIRDLLEFSIIGKNLIFTSVDCNTLLKEVIAQLDFSIKETNAKINSTVLPVLIGNDIELKRLFQNLIGNAIKFRKKNKSPEVTISAEENDTEYLFAVKDNGIGIEEQFMHKLFIIFQRLHPEYPGTGIGLAICKKIIALHNGKIWVESKIGEGSTFYFTISKSIQTNS